MSGDARPRLSVSTAGIQTLGAPMTVDVAREADALGYRSVWVAEANAAEAMSLLGAVSVAAPGLGLGTGVVALQLRTPPLAAMAAATLQQLAPDRDVLLGIGISSPVVAGQWHGADYGDRPLARVREYIALVRECLSGEAVSFEGDFWTVKRFRLGLRLGDRRPKIVVGALNEGMLRLGGEVADGVLLNYLPASHVPWSVARVREGGPAAIYAFVHCGVTDRDRFADVARKDLFSYAVVDAYAASFARAGYADEVDALRAAHAARDRDGAVAAVSDRWVDEVQIMGDAAHVRDAVDAYRRNGVDEPIVFALPWGDDRRATVSSTLRAAISADPS
jgi:probable F420-dependent oxidoreductase